MLPNHLVKNTELWEKRKQVDWTIDIEPLENGNIAYIEQLAFLKGNKKLSFILAYNLIKKAFDNGAEFILTTTVRKPIINTAAISSIKAVGGLKVGNIDEIYDEVGNINSDIYLFSKESFFSKIKELSIYNFLRMNQI